MDLYTILDDKKLHKNFIAIMDDYKKEEREEFNRWAHGFIDRDKKFIKQFQETFNSSFWEIYLYALFKDYGISVEWNYSSPDFILSSKYGDFIVEAVTANAAQEKLKEWEWKYNLDQLSSINWLEFNTEAIIRYSNAFFNKFHHYKEKYSKLEHVKKKPFVIALGSFTQPNFTLESNRGMLALLYDIYLDEDEYYRNPAYYSKNGGVPEKKLGFVEKDNGAEIELGVFNDNGCEEISAVIFSCTATWGKVSAMTKDKPYPHIITWNWADKNNFGQPLIITNKDREETLTDGLMIFHNPFAKNPLDPKIFRREGVVQFIFDKATGYYVVEENHNCMHYRIVQNFVIKKT